MKKCFAWVLVLAMLLSMCGVVIAAEDAPAASAADVVIEPQNAAPAAQDVGEGEEGSGETPTPVHTDHPVCGDAACTDESHATDVEWKSLNEAYAAAGNKLPTAGNYYLTDDLAVSAALTVSGGKTINLCLNGHKLTRAGRPLAAYSKGTLNVCDCSADKSGEVTATSAHGGYAGLLTIETDGEVNLYSVSLKGGSTAKNKNGNGDGAAIYVKKGTLNMIGGRIESCKAAATGNGAVYVAGGSAELDGVSITGCEAVNGSAIYVKSGASCTIKGGVIQSNTASDSGAVYVENGGELVLSGAPSIQGNTNGNVYLPAGVTVTLDDDFSAAAKVGVSVAGVDSTTDTQTTFATSATDFSKCFTADADGVVTAYVAPAEGECCCD